MRYNLSKVLRGTFNPLYNPPSKKVGTPYVTTCGSEDGAARGIFPDRKATH